MPDIAFITAQYGDYDTLKVPFKQEGIDAEWVVVTDSLELYGENSVFAAPTYGNESWRVVYDPHPGNQNEIPFRAAKKVKTQPWLYTDAPASIWIDGTVTIQNPKFAVDALALTENIPIACMPHDARDCLYDEAAASKLVKYLGEPVQEQAEFYRSQGHPEHWGCWLTTILVRRHTADVKQMSEAWQNEINFWSSQDQVSYPYVSRNFNLRPVCMHGGTERWKFNRRFSAKHQAANCPPVKGK